MLLQNIMKKTEGSIEDQFDYYEVAFGLLTDSFFWNFESK